RPELATRRLLTLRLAACGALQHGVHRVSGGDVPVRRQRCGHTVLDDLELLDEVLGASTRRVAAAHATTLDRAYVRARPVWRGRVRCARARRAGPLQPGHWRATPRSRPAAPAREHPRPPA